MRHDSPNEELRRIAESKLRPCGHDLAPGQRDAAVALLADLYATGLGHGVTPEDWAAVAGLDIECLDAIRFRDPLSLTRKATGLSPNSGRCRDTDLNRPSAALRGFER